ncbi:MAG: GGDEF domain-containing protein, partial [Oscillospiraceae bacterium]|nr:GGDEF domain-containing protein [Oscillospiraceae bacterium]
TVVVAIIAAVGFAIVSSHTSAALERHLVSLENDIKAAEGLDQATRDRLENRRKEIAKEVDNNANTISIVFAIITFVIAGASAVIIGMNVTKMLRVGISKPLIEMAYEIKKANEGLEEVGITMIKDTEDEVALVNSVYFDMVEQLKSYMDDVSKLSGLTEKFENSANFDALTGVYNRRRFFELVQKHAVIAAKKNEPTYVVMLDLDFFKKVNDTYGHAAGDEVLKVIATRVKGTFRPYDLFGRYGGEEFIMFISASDNESAIAFAERVRIVVQEEPVHFEGKDIPITSSFGVAQVAPVYEFEEALKLADEALYDAKANGRNRVELYVPPTA